MADKRPDPIEERFGLVNLEFLSGKRVTVAGASGFVGQNLVRRLNSEGSKVRALIHESPVSEKLEGVEYVKVDLMTRRGAALAADGAEIFVMAAATSSGAAVMANSPLTHLVPNIVMNALVLEACLNAEVQKYCFLSSNTVYPPGDAHMREEAATGEFFESYEVVAGMKYYSETMAKLFSTKAHRAMQVLIVRPGNLYGPFDKFSEGKAKVIPALIKRAVSKEVPFTVWGDGQDIKDFLYIEDFVEGLLRALKLDGQFDVINLASGNSVRLQEVIEKILVFSEHLDVEVIFDKSKPSMIPVRHIDVSRAREKLDWVAKTSLDEGLRKTIDWYKASIKDGLETK